MPTSTTYTTKPGDSAETLAKTYNTTPEALIAANPTGTFQDMNKTQTFWGPNVSLNIPGQIPTPTLIVTSGSIQKQFSTDTMNLADIQFQKTQPAPTQPLPSYGNYSDQYTKSLDALGVTSDATTKALINSIQAQRANRANEINNLAGNYERGLQLLGIQKNEAQSTPELLMGRISEAENQRISKIQQLDVEENKAILDAKQAQQENNVRLLKEKMDYIRQIRKDKQDEIKAAADEATQHLEKINKEVSLMSGYASNIISQISGLQGDAKMKAIQAIADKFNVSPEAVILAASGYQQGITDEQRKQGYKTGKISTIAAPGGGTESPTVQKIDALMYKSKPTFAGEKLFIDPDQEAKVLQDLNMTSKAFVQIQKYLLQGYSLKHVAQILGMPPETYTALSQYVTKGEE